MGIKIIVDSGSDILQDQYEQVKVLPLSVVFGEEQLYDGVTIDAKTFYERLESSEVLPKTSQVAPGKYAEAYEECIANGDDILVITVSSKLSGCYQSATIASSLVDQKVYIVDSKTASVGIHALVKEGIKLIQQGKSVEEIYEELNRMKEKLYVFALVDTLEYLKKGGRVSNIAALAGTIFSIKPVITTIDGTLQVVGKARGTKLGANLLTKQIEKTGIDLNKAIVTGYSGNNSALLEEYLEAHADVYNHNLDYITRAVIGPGIGTHAGPNAIVVGFFGK